MSIFDRLKNSQRASEPLTVWLSDCSTTSLIIPEGYRSLASCPEVVAAVNVYATMVSRMTIHLMKNGDLGDTRVVNGLSRLVDIAPNPYMTKQPFYQAIIRGMMLGNGNQVTVPVFSEEFIDRLVPLNPADVKFEENGEGYRIIYKNKKVYQPNDVLHFRINPSTEYPWLGTGFEVLLKDVIRSLAQTSTTKRSLLEKPAPSIIVRVDSNAEELASEQGRRTLSQRFLNGRSNGEPWIIPADMMGVDKIAPMTMQDLAIKENLELDKTAVATMLGVPPFLLGVGEFNKEEFNNFIRTRISGIAKVIEEELTAKLLIAPEWHFKMNARSLMAYDIEEITSIGSSMVDRTAMTRNEWRDWLGLSPRDDMEELIVLENYLPIDKIGQQKKLKGNDNG